MTVACHTLEAGTPMAMLCSIVAALSVSWDTVSMIFVEAFLFTLAVFFGWVWSHGTAAWFRAHPLAEPLAAGWKREVVGNAEHTINGAVFGFATAFQWTLFHPYTVWWVSLVHLAQVVGVCVVISSLWSGVLLAMRWLWNRWLLSCQPAALPPQPEH
jgi:hypothetical protein